MNENSNSSNQVARAVQESIKPLAAAVQGLIDVLAAQNAPPMKKKKKRHVKITGYRSDASDEVMSVPDRSRDPSPQITRKPISLTANMNDYVGPANPNDA